MNEEKTVSVSLNMEERFTIMGSLLPPENDIIYIRTSKVLREMLTPTEGEEDEYDFQNVPTNDGRTMVVWRKELKDKEREFSFTPRAFGMIQKSLKDLNSATPPKLTEQHVSLWDKFDMDKE